LKIVCFFILIFSSYAYAAPEISVGSLYDYILSGKSAVLKRVRNIGDEPAFVRVDLLEIVYKDGKPIEEALPGEGVRQLIASPSRLVIGANGVQATRLVFIGERDKERYFRVRYVPVTPEADEVPLAFKDRIDAGVSVVTGFGTILFVSPSSTVYKTDVSRKAGILLVKNNGNATVILDYLEVCDGSGKNCSQPGKIHILPGSERAFGLPNAVVRFELIEGESAKTHEYNP